MSFHLRTSHAMRKFSGLLRKPDRHLRRRTMHLIVFANKRCRFMNAPMVAMTAQALGGSIKKEVIYLNSVPEHLYMQWAIRTRFVIVSCTLSSVTSPWLLVRKIRFLFLATRRPLYRPADRTGPHITVTRLADVNNCRNVGAAIARHPTRFRRMLVRKGKLNKRLMHAEIAFLRESTSLWRSYRRRVHNIIINNGTGFDNWKVVCCVVISCTTVKNNKKKNISKWRENSWLVTFQTFDCPRMEQKSHKNGGQLFFLCAVKQHEFVIWKLMRAFILIV